MIRFRNPGTTYDTQISLFKALYNEYKSCTSFGLDEIAYVATNSNLMTAYGFSGNEALSLSMNPNSSLNATKMNAKMYAEIYRQLGWISSCGSKAYPVSFTFLGRCIAESDNPLPLYEQCVLGINNPQQIMNVSYTEKSRFFKTCLNSLVDLNGIMYKQELCLGPMSINDVNEADYNNMIGHIKKIRGRYSYLENDFANLCSSLKMKNSSVDNCTRVPIAYMKTCGWIETDIPNSDLYKPKNLKCFKITNHGRFVQNTTKGLYDLRLEDFNKCTEKVQNSLIRLGLFDMLDRAGYDISKYKKLLSLDKDVCIKNIRGRKLLFSPYQTLKMQRVDEALCCYVDISCGIKKKNHSKINSRGFKSENTRSYASLVQSIALDINVNTETDCDDEIIKFKNRVQEYLDNGLSVSEIVSQIFSKSINMKNKEFYPFVAMLFRVIGFDCHASRRGDNGMRFDALISDEKNSIPIEIKSPTEELYLSLKAVRQALENKIVMLSRKQQNTNFDTTSLVVGYYMPNERADVASLVQYIKQTYNINIGIIDFKTLLTIALSYIVEVKTFDREKFIKTEGFIDGVIKE